MVNIYWSSLNTLLSFSLSPCALSPASDIGVLRSLILQTRFSDFLKVMFQVWGFKASLSASTVQAF